MTQTWAIFLDAYHELNAKRLFWLVLVLSFLIVAAFGAMGLTPSGLTLFGFSVDSSFFNSSIMPVDKFYRFLFVQFGVKIWLAWAATILALVSTAGMIPEFIASGSVELSLSKPIGRVRLFLTKYAAGLLFAAMQVTVFSIGAFFVLGLRGKVWDVSVFAAIPIVVAFFSFLYCICALLGLVTRSTIASILLTLVIWLTIFLAGTVEWIIRGWDMASEQRVANLETTIRTLEQHNVGEWQIEDRREQLKKAKQQEKLSGRINAGMEVFMTVLPKTTETVGLLERALFTEEEITAAMKDDYEEVQETDEVDMRRVQRQIVKERLERSPWWILGTSLGFEAAVLALACVIFARRDF